MSIPKTTGKSAKKPAGKKSSSVKTLRGADAWNMAGSKPRRRKSSTRMSGFGKKGGILETAMNGVMSNLKPVAGGVASKMVVNTAVKKSKSPNAGLIGSIVAFIAMSTAERYVPAKMATVRQLVNGAAIGSGMVFAEHLAKKIGVTSLQGFEDLDGFEEIALEGYVQDGMLIREIPVGMDESQYLATDLDGFAEMNGFYSPDYEEAEVLDGYEAEDEIDSMFA